MNPGSFSAQPFDARLLTSENPFAILGVPLEVSPVDLRRRLEELQMLARMEAADQSADALQYQEAGNTLQDTNRRLQSEMFSPWTGSTTYLDAALQHDTALEAVRALFGRVNGAGASGLGALTTDAIVRWGAVAGDPAVSAAIEARSRSLGMPMDAHWLEESVAGTLVGIVQRAPSLLVGEAHADERSATLRAAAEQLAKLPPAISYSAAVVVIDRTRSTIESQMPTTSDVMMRIIPPALSVTRTLGSIAPGHCAALTSWVTQEALKAAGTLFVPEHPAEAERLLGLLQAGDLDAADRLEVDQSLQLVRFVSARTAAMGLIKNGHLPASVSALRRAEALAPDDESRVAVRNDIRAVEATIQKRSDSTRNRWIGWGVVAVIVVAIGIASSGKSGGSSAPTSSNCDSDAATITRLRRTLQSQSDELEQQSNAIDALGSQLEATQRRYPNGAPDAVVRQYNADRSRYQSLVSQFNAFKSDYDSAISIFNRRVSTYNANCR